MFSLIPNYTYSWNNPLFQSYPSQQSNGSLEATTQHEESSSSAVDTKPTAKKRIEYYTDYPFHEGIITKDSTGKVVKVSRFEKREKLLCCNFCKTVEDYRDIGRWIGFFSVLYTFQAGLFAVLYVLYEVTPDFDLLWFFFALFVLFVVCISVVALKANNAKSKRSQEILAMDDEKDNYGVHRVQVKIYDKSSYKMRQKEEPQQEEYKQDWSSGEEDEESKA